MKAVTVRAPGSEPGRKRIGPVTPASYKKTTVPANNSKMSAAERVKMMIKAKLEGAHEKEKIKRIIRTEELEDAKKERQREWRSQVRHMFIICIQEFLTVFTAPKTKRTRCH